MSRVSALHRLHYRQSERRCWWNRHVEVFQDGVYLCVHVVDTRCELFMSFELRNVPTANLARLKLIDDLFHEGLLAAASWLHLTVSTGDVSLDTPATSTRLLQVDASELCIGPLLHRVAAIVINFEYGFIFFEGQQLRGPSTNPK